MFYEYPSHYIYDFIVISMTVLVGRQAYNIKMSPKQYAVYTAFMMLCYQINFYIIVPFFPREFKYVTLYVGLLLAFLYILKLKLIPALIVIVSAAAFNGIWTNINLYFMLKYVFENYGKALEAVHAQYSYYVISVIILSSLVLISNIKVVDIQKYN